MDLGLEGKAVAVTGGSKGIGKATVRELLKEGARVSTCARGRAALDKTVAELRADPGGDLIGVTADLTNPADAERFIAETVKAFGRIDVLVNNAGSAPGGIITDLTEADWAEALQLKLMGQVRCCKAVIPHMLKQGGGRIVNIIGNDGVKPVGSEITPSAANAADIAITIALADQYGRQNICVNAINPGPVDTERWAWLISSFAKSRGITPEAANQRAANSIPLNRICSPEEVANVVAFVASERASFMNGAVINLDGGQRKALLEVES